jgi:hypothetical protein
MNTDLNNNNGSSNFLNFSDALNHLRWGERLARRGWSGRANIKINYVPESASAKPRIERTRSGDRYSERWYPTQTDILAEDWYVLGDHQ